MESSNEMYPVNIARVTLKLRLNLCQINSIIKEKLKLDSKRNENLLHNSEYFFIFYYVHPLSLTL